MISLRIVIQYHIKLFKRLSWEKTRFYFFSPQRGVLQPLFASLGQQKALLLSFTDHTTVYFTTISVSFPPHYSSPKHPLCFPVRWHLRSGMLSTPSSVSLSLRYLTRGSACPLISASSTRMTGSRTTVSGRGMSWYRECLCTRDENTH